MAHHGILIDAKGERVVENLAASLADQMDVSPGVRFASALPAVHQEHLNQAETAQFIDGGVNRRKAQAGVAFFYLPIDD
jgi:hypothetical protein